MSTIADVIDDIRIELDDAADARWSDANLVKLIAKSVRRLSHVLRRNEIPFARTYGSISTVSGTESYSLPSDFMAAVGLFRDATNMEMTQYADAAFERIVSAAEFATYCIRGGSVYINGTPTSAENLTLIYWPIIDTSAYATDTTMPWDGKLDDIIAEYCAIRCKNIDEMDLAYDAKLMTDIENNILSTYGTLNPSMTTMRGWLPTTYDEVNSG